MVLGQNIFVCRYLPSNKNFSLCPPCLRGEPRVGGSLALEEEREIEVESGPRRRTKENTATKVDGFVKSRKTPFSVIPANPGSGSGTGAGIQFINRLRKHLDSGFHQSDDFLRVYQQLETYQTGEDNYGHSKCSPRR